MTKEHEAKLKAKITKLETENKRLKQELVELKDRIRLYPDSLGPHQPDFK